MSKSCMNCLKYPMCAQYQEVMRSCNKHSIMKSTQTIFISMAANCHYYKADEDD